MDYRNSNCAVINQFHIIEQAAGDGRAGRAAQAAADGPNGICGTIVFILFRGCLFAPANRGPPSANRSSPAANRSSPAENRRPPAENRRPLAENRRPELGRSLLGIERRRENVMIARREKQKIRTNRQTAMHVSRVSIAINLVLSAFKLFAGVAAHSGAMISDGIHSASDVLSTLIVMAGVVMAGRQSDKEHPYGHERMECVAAILLAAVLFATGAGVGVEAVKTVVLKGNEGLTVPGRLAMFAAALSIVVKEWMYWYTRAAAKQTDSQALMADAWHHRSDALSSVGALAGIAGARMGFAVLDPAASLVICLFIVKAAAGIFRDAVDRMVDKSCGDATVEAMRRTALEMESVLGVDGIRTRMFGPRIYVDLEIAADPALRLDQAHHIAHQVHDAIEAEFPQVKHCMVHVNPYVVKEDGDEEMWERE